MTLVAYRMIALINIDRSKTRRSKDGISVVVLTHEKGDTGQGRTEMLIRAQDEERTSPLYYHDTLDGSLEELGGDHALLCSDTGKEYKRSDVIGKALTALLRSLGIEGYTGHSFRHALV
jgi:hypothetical protein